jgi:rhamnose transport system substrate-binding protein
VLRLHRHLVRVLLSLGVTLAFLAPGAFAASRGQILLLPKFTGIPVFTQVDQGATAVAKKFGYSIDYNGPTTASASAQVQFIDNAVANHYKGIMISADNPDAVAPALERAMKKGVAVVSFDSDVLPAARSVFVAGASNQAIADIELQMLGSQIGYKGNFAIVSSTPTETNQNTWIALMKQDLKSNPKYKNMHLQVIVYGTDDPSQAITVTQGLLQRFPNIKGIISPTTIGIAAAAQVLATQKGSHVVLTGLGDPEQMRPYVKSGVVKEFALWSFEREGEVAAYAMHALLTHQITGKAGQSFDAGPYGRITIGPQGLVIAGPPVVFTKQNIDKYNY